MRIAIKDSEGARFYSKSSKRSHWVRVETATAPAWYITRNAFASILRVSRADPGAHILRTR